MPDWDLLIQNARLATMRDGGYSVSEGNALAVSDGEIAWIGRASEIKEGSAEETIEAHGQWLTPSLIDCHTHIVFGGDRAAEYEQRLQGVSYADIAKAGGGIQSTVASTRAAPLDDLVGTAALRVQDLINEGVTTIEIKSGYGLDCDTEIAMLRAASRVAEKLGVSVRKTYLGAHTVPAETDADVYVDFIVNDGLPAANESGLVDAVDGYCEHIAFTDNQIARVFEKAQQLGLPVKLHADQLSDCGGAALAASFAALSADHLEYTNEAGVEAMAEARTVAVLLPGAFVTLNETQRPPMDAFRSNGVPVAVATDCNPGTSPMSSILMAMQLASREFSMTPEECLAGATCHAAKALGFDDRGTLQVGQRADLALWNIEHPRDLSYWMGGSPLAASFCGGTRLR